jgi:DNA-binding transcriptional LysR family regulator
MELGPIDGALATLGLRRDIAVVVGGFASALALARRSDLVATVPARNTHLQTEGMATFDLPFATPPLRLYMLWHPWVDADPVHQWLRSCLWEVCQATGR